MSKIGFCFTGEGARGSVQAGIALGLYNQNIVPDFTIGVSSGSICAASYSYLGAQGLVDMWSEINGMFDVFGFNWLFPWKRGILNQKPMEKIVKKVMQYNTPLCESIVSRMYIEDGFIDYVSNKRSTKDEFAEAVLGAVAITALVEDRNGWVDAGSRQLAPLEQCLQNGCDKVYVILGRKFEMDTWKIPTGFFPILKMGYRALDISLNEMMLRDINKCLKNEGDFGYKNIDIHIIEPNDTIFESMEFSKCKEGVKYGKDNYSILDRKGLVSALNL